MKLKSYLSSVIFIFVWLCLASCDNSPTSLEAFSSSVTTATTISNKVIIQNNLTKKVKFNKRGETDTFLLNPTENGLRLQGSEGENLINLAIKNNGKIQITKSSGSILGHVFPENNYLAIEDAEETSILYILRQQVDDGYQLESANKEIIYSIKSRDYGFEIETPEQESLYRINIKDKKVTLKDAYGNTVLETESDFSLLAIACYGFDVLDFSQQTALAYAVSLMEN